MSKNKTQISPDQLIFTIDWGELFNDINNQTDLIAMLNSKTNVNHNHDGIYLPIDGTAANSSKLDGQLPIYYTTAQNIYYNNAISGLLATNVQAAIDEIVSNPPQTGSSNIREIIKNTSCTLTIDEVSNTIINNLGQSNDVELILPEATSGLSFMVIIGMTSSYKLILTANENNIIYLYEYQSDIFDSTSSVILNSVSKCNCIAFSTFKTGDKYDWEAVSISGDWTVATIE